MTAPALLEATSAHHPPVNPGGEVADYSYRETMETPAPQVYGSVGVSDGPLYGAEGLAGEPGFEKVDIVERLTEEDGLVMGTDGKLHFKQVGNVASGDVRYDEPTGDYHSDDRRAVDMEREHLRSAGVAHPAAATAIVRMAVDGGYHGTVYQHQEPRSHRTGRHRA